MADARASDNFAQFAAVSDWHVFRSYVTVTDGTELPVGAWTPTAGEPVSVQLRRQHIIGWNLTAHSPLTLDPGEVPEGIITPTGTAYLYTMGGDPTQGGQHFRDVAELKDTILATLAEVYAKRPQAKPA
jgi:hypothetical protein